MSGPRGAPILTAVSGLLGISSTLAMAASGSVSTELAHCATIATAEPRLACYDALAGRVVTGHAPPADRATVAALPRAVFPAASAPAPVAAVAMPPATPAAPAAAAAAAPNPADAEMNFGLSNAQLHTALQGPKSIQAHVTRVTEDQQRRDFVLLDNGQTWASTEGEMQLDSGELVTIGHGALGSFMLVSTSSKHSYHVRRVR